MNAVEALVYQAIQPKTCLNEQDQGYFLETVYTGPSQCTRQAWNNYVFFNGITCISTHGHRTVDPDGNGPMQPEVVTEVDAYISPYFGKAGKEDALRWIGADTETMKRVPIAVYDDNGRVVRNLSVVKVKNKWFRQFWRGIHNTQRTLVCAHVCGSEAVLNSLGGRTGFGYSGSRTVIVDGVAAYNAIFSCMNGTSDSGGKRLSGEALAAGASEIVMAGSAFTTLVPSVKHPTTINPGSDPASGDNVYPLGRNAPSPASSPITGHVIFDTAMDVSIPANTILTATVMSGSVEIDPAKIVWSGNHRINFEYKRSGYGYSSGGTENFEVEMRVNAQLANGANSNYDLNGGNKHLDGGNIGSDRGGVHAVADNEDDFVWRFSRD